MRAAYRSHHLGRTPAVELTAAVLPLGRARREITVYACRECDSTLRGTGHR